MKKKKTYNNKNINNKYKENSFIITIGILFILLISSSLSYDIDNKIIKFKKDGEIIIYDKFDKNNIIKTNLNSPLIEQTINVNNINWTEINILPFEDDKFTLAIPNKDISSIIIPLKEIKSNTPFILKQYPNLLFNSNITFSLFSINGKSGDLKKNFFVKNNGKYSKKIFKLIKNICPLNKEEILFLRLDYYIRSKYTYIFKKKNNNNIIFYLHYIKIIPLYPKVNFDINMYDDNNEFYEEDDYYIFGINNNNDNLDVIYSFDKTLYGEISDIMNEFNFNNYYLDKNRKKIVIDEILYKNEDKKKYFYYKIKLKIVIFILFIAIFILSIIFIFYKNKKYKNNNNNKIEQEEKIDINNENNIDINKSEIDNPNINNNNEKTEENIESIEIITKKARNSDLTRNLFKLKSCKNNLEKNNSFYLNKNNKSYYKQNLYTSTKYKIEKNNLKEIIKEYKTNFKKRQTSSIEEKNELENLFKTYLEDIIKNNNNDSPFNLNTKNPSIKNKYKKIYSLLEETEKSTIKKGKKDNNDDFNNKDYNYFIDTGRLLKEFKDFEFIGKGGFGIVLKTINILDQGQWAIKIMKINLENKGIKELNAIQEIKMMSKFKKKNIVRYKTCWFEFEQNKRRAKSLEKNLHQKKPKKKKKKKRKMSVVWDSDEDSLGANKGYVIKEEGENIPLDDNDDSEDNENNENNDSMSSEDGLKKNISSSDDFTDSNNNNYFLKKNNSSKNILNESSSNLKINSNENTSNYNLAEKNSETSNNLNPEDDSSKNNLIYFFIQMEYCSGCPMNYYLSHRKKVPSKILTSYIFFQMCYAVKHIHESDIIHRDLKPGNIFIMNDYLIKIGDFGLALYFNKTLNEQGGTYLYQSPEQIQEQPYDQKVDIFALGVILVELLSKFNTESERVEVLKGLKNNSYPEYLKKDYLHEYKLIKKMTRLKPDERPNIQDIFRDEDFKALMQDF